MDDLQLFLHKTQLEAAFAQALAPHVRKLFGLFGLTLASRVLPQMQEVPGTQISVSMVPQVPAGSGLLHLPKADLVGNFEDWPVRTHSLDWVFLHHALCFSDDPYQVLREVDRCLTPDGSLLISGLHPWLVWSHPYQMRKNFPTFGQYHWVSLGHLIGWLNLLGYEIQGLDYVSPLMGEPVGQKLRQRFLPLSHALSYGYLLKAQKSTRRIRPAGLKAWRWQGLVNLGGFAKAQTHVVGQTKAESGNRISTKGSEIA